MIQVKSITKQFRKFCVVNDVFDKSEIGKIIELQDLQNFIKGTIGSTNSGVPIYHPKLRDAEVSCIDPNDHNSRWLYEKITNLIPQVNYDFFMHPLSCMEPLQYIVYKENHHYDWHIDSFYDSVNSLNRKISFTVVISGPDEYEGGELQCVLDGRVHDPVTLRPNAGDVVFFDSMFPHKVCPVTKGTRKTLVSWVLGNNHAWF